METEQPAAPDAITRRLAADERLIWWDRPDPLGVAKYELNFATLFGVVFAVFAIIWMTLASRAAGLFFMLGLPFLLIGVWMVSAPLRAYRNARRALYALTDQRALILTDNVATSRPLEQIPFFETTSFADGNGHVLFYSEPAPLLPVGMPHQLTIRKYGFVAIRDAEKLGSEMQTLITQRRQKASAPE